LLGVLLSIQKKCGESSEKWSYSFAPSKTQREDRDFYDQRYLKSFGYSQKSPAEASEWKNV
jgi:hypothetical protein